MLAELFGHPDRELPLSELGRLVERAFLLDRYEGRNPLVRANVEHPLFGPMRDLIAATHGPVPMNATPLSVEE